MAGSILAERYAKALFQLAEEQKAVEPVHEDMKQLSSLIKQSRDLLHFLRSPVINPGKKEKILKKLLSGNINPLTMSFILLLVRKRREVHIPDIAVKFVEIYNDHFNIVTVKLKSPVKVTSEIRNEVLKIMKQYTEATVHLEEVVDESLIGGFLLTWKDNQYDVSIRSELNKLTRGIAKINLYKKEM